MVAVKTVAAYMIKGKYSHNKPTLPFLNHSRQAGVQNRWEAMKGMTNAQALS
jgi:hypothetical protein